jgi:hypothetical protein
LSGDSIQRVVQPSVNQDVEKAPALKFGQPRVMALTMFQNLINGFHNRDLRARVVDLGTQKNTAPPCPCISAIRASALRQSGRSYNPVYDKVIEIARWDFVIFMAFMVATTFSARTRITPMLCTKLSGTGRG